MEKCKSCGFSCKSKEVMKQHMTSRHGVKLINHNGFKCLMCTEVLMDKQSFMKHKADHQRELDVITFNDVCTKCSLSFGSREDYLEHLLEKHRPKQYNDKQTGLKKSKESEECENGPNCKWLKTDSCKFEHNKQPWSTVQNRMHKKQTKQHQARVVEQSYAKTQATKVCTNGPSCKFLKQDRCNFFHKEKRHQGKQVRQDTRSSAQQQSGGQSKLKPCKFGRNCDKGRNCGFLHLP